MNAFTTQPEWYRVTEAKKPGQASDKAPVQGPGIGSNHHRRWFDRGLYIKPLFNIEIILPGHTHDDSFLSLNQGPVSTFTK